MHGKVSDDPILNTVRFAETAPICVTSKPPPPWNAGLPRVRQHTYVRSPDDRTVFVYRGSD